jgi:hypothetical protein
LPDNALNSSCGGVAFGEEHGIVPGLTTDYILRGVMDGMTVDLRRRIEAVEQAEDSGE